MFLSPITCLAALKPADDTESHVLCFSLRTRTWPTSSMWWLPHCFIPALQCVLGQLAALKVSSQGPGIATWQLLPVTLTSCRRTSFQLHRFQSSSLFMCLGSQRKMTQLPGSLPPSREIWMELRAPEFGPAQPQSLWLLGSDPREGRSTISVHVPLPPFYLLLFL